MVRGSISITCNNCCVTSAMNCDPLSVKTSPGGPYRPICASKTLVAEAAVTSLHGTSSINRENTSMRWIICASLYYYAYIPLSRLG